MAETDDQGTTPASSPSQPLRTEPPAFVSLKPQTGGKGGGSLPSEETDRISGRGAWPQYVETPAGFEPKLLPNGTTNKTRKKVKRLARLIVEGGMTVLEAADALAIGQTQVYRLIQSVEYQREREKLILKHAPARADVIRHIESMQVENAVVASYRLKDILSSSENEGLVGHLANLQLDRIGARAASKSEVKVEVELSEQTAALIAKAQASVQVPRETIPLEASEFAYALEAPKRAEGSVAERVGRGVEAEKREASE